ncbi:MAG: CRISPR-associated endonuclease Cas2 [Actinomycetota bacterium]
MEVLVAYDVSTETAAGRRRLRQVAHICEAFGQRVQKSVFECVLSEAELEDLQSKLESAVRPAEDSLRIYRLREPRNRFMRVIGRAPRFDLRDPLVL